MPRVINGQTVKGRLTFDKLVATGVFMQNDKSDGSWDGLLFECDDIAVQVHRQTLPNRIATLLEVDGKWYLGSGYHYVNRFGYFLATEDLPDFDVPVGD